MIQKFFKKVASYIIKPILAKYLNKPRNYYYKPFNLTILPGVFHPAFFYSTKFLLQYLQKINLQNSSVIEVGAGNGLISFSLALKAKKVVALEISKIAIKGLNINAQNNQKVLPKNVLQIIESNLFQKLEPAVYDYIVVNPPYFPKKVTNEHELAWNCGVDFEYFKAFFNQVVHFMDTNSKIMMVLSSECNVNKISEIAGQNKLKMELKVTKKFLIEDNYIFQITCDRAIN